MDRACAFQEQCKAPDHIHCPGRLHSVIRKSKNKSKLADMAETHLSDYGIMSGNTDSKK